MAYKINAAARDLFYSRNDPKDRRLGELIGRAAIDEVTEWTVAIIGVPEDRGITANKGRAGAAAGPDDIRRRLYKLTPGFNSDFMRLRIVDVGNVDTKELTLAEVHDAETEAVAEIVARGGLPVVLGGGHDLTYPGVRGLVTGANIGRGGMGLINVDAHLDVRSDENGINSGTSGARAGRPRRHAARGLGARHGIFPPGAQRGGQERTRDSGLARHRRGAQHRSARRVREQPERPQSARARQDSLPRGAQR